MQHTYLDIYNFELYGSIKSFKKLFMVNIIPDIKSHVIKST